MTLAPTFPYVSSRDDFNNRRDPSLAKVWTIWLTLPTSRRPPRVTAAICPEPCGSLHPRVPFFFHHTNTVQNSGATGDFSLFRGSHRRVIRVNDWGYEKSNRFRLPRGHNDADSTWNEA